jgi:CheY-like chemotaxis protein
MPWRLRPRILVVDDERAFTDVLAELLEQEGYRVDRAYDGEQALRLLQIGQPDLVLSDVMLPKLSGTDLVRAARKLVPAGRLPFILLSAGRDPGLVEDRVSFLAKPLDLDRLLREVQQLLEASLPMPAGSARAR